MLYLEQKLGKCGEFKLIQYETINNRGSDIKLFINGISKPTWNERHWHFPSCVAHQTSPESPLSSPPASSGKSPVAWWPSQLPLWQSAAPRWQKKMDGYGGPAPSNLRKRIRALLELLQVTINSSKCFFITVEPVLDSEYNYSIKNFPRIIMYITKLDKTNISTLHELGKRFGTGRWNGKG